jgi:putative membrane protein
MMWWWYGGNAGAWYWWGWLGLALMIIFWMLVIWGIVMVVRYLSSTRTAETSRREGPMSPEDILRERLARGEIDADEYQTRLKLLQSTGSHKGDGRNTAR